LFLAITITAAVVVYEMGMPIINKMQAAALIDDMRETFTELDQQIQEVAAEGKGSKRTFYLQLSGGELRVNSSKNWIQWEYDTSAPVISPRTAQWIGNVIIGSNLETKAYEETYEGTDCYVLENEHLKVYINKTGTASSFSQLRTSDMFVAIRQKGLDTLLGLESINVTLDNAETSETGYGYTGVQKLGENLPYATAFMHMNSTYERYFINVTLESGADFIIIEGSVIE